MKPDSAAEAAGQQPSEDQVPDPASTAGGQEPALARDEPSHYENIQRALALLYEHFPKAFIKEGAVRPLKLGIFEDLRQRAADIEGLSLTKIRAALRIYTSRLKYLHSIKEGARRIDLDGREGNEVTPEHIAHAKERLAEIQARRKEAYKKLKSKNAAPPQAAADADGGAQPGAQLAADAAPVNTPPKSRSNKGNLRQQATSPAGGADHAGAMQADSDAERAHQQRGKAHFQPHRGDGQQLYPGAAVLVQSNPHNFVRGVVTKTEKGSVMVTLASGITVNMPYERVKLAAVGELHTGRSRRTAKEGLGGTSREH